MSLFSDICWSLAPHFRAWARAVASCVVDTTLATSGTLMMHDDAGWALLGFLRPPGALGLELDDDSSQQLLSAVGVDYSSLGEEIARDWQKFSTVCTFTITLRRESQLRRHATYSSLCRNVKARVSLQITHISPYQLAGTS